MSKLSRRTLILNSATAAIALTVTGTASAREPQARNQIPSCELRALIKAHKATYASFGRAIHETCSSGRDCSKAARAEEEALMAVCSFPAVSEADRRVKAKYLLKVEARGELDLKEHMQAVLRSTLWSRNA
ncbi:hypothetical protein [Allomesorhizobium camelthorni]|uniref:Secreted protein n=1 Tax=Allomesorhizobium camelthorni TaxID=475069 RepID=A0A6G4WPF7_9HYPH|nr:hypothetical protein [Mesorhizobium camelthorni]NGO56073.1 hypothetical protein [Mesorhizobium camelthorni]